MPSDKPQTVHRLDYRPPDYWIDRVDLHVALGETGTRVRARLALRRNEMLAGDPPPLVLDGEGLETHRVAVDGRELGAGEFHVGEERLSIASVPARFELETEVTIHPERNTALLGLYRSGSMFCTQCEAMGFRRITWFLDRPDVMARYTTTIEADRASCPVLLSNGNRVEARELDGGRHRVRWEDPFPKPSYLFALVAGDLRCHAGSFTTASGRPVQLEIWVEPQNVDACEHALRSLQKAMRWDEQTFGLEYDLDLYMIVAVNDFNFGAMENKGLNVFNSKYVLARPETATDDDYEAVEGVIAHEYFHNWTGNRVTCRDWFQLTLKEGLTVFRDQEFSAWATSAAVKRIADVRNLRAVQFDEDAGPMAHPIRPESYISMDNFYTATVYEKGAEVIRLYHTLLGSDGFRRGMDRYFERHDGQAVTCDDFRAAMADANGADLGQLGRWYEQAGTPRVEFAGTWDAASRRYTLTLSQSIPATPYSDPDAPPPPPLHLPVAVGLLGGDGRELPLRLAGEPTAGASTRVLALREREQQFVFEDVPERPVASLLRGFSAPVRVAPARPREELAFLLAHDPDPFSRWDAGQSLASDVLLALARDAAADRPLRGDEGLAEALRAVLRDDSLDGSFRALLLALPAERVLAQAMDPVDPGALHAARHFAVRDLAERLRADLEATYRACDPRAPYELSPAAIDRRRLKNTALRYLGALERPESAALAAAQLAAADNMTDAQAALSVLAELEAPEREQALAAFYERWRADPLVLDKWFATQALSRRPDTLERVRALTGHADFSLTNPNRVRALLGSFCMGNPVRFHAPDGAGYVFLVDQVLALDPLNPKVAARLVGALNGWRRYEPARRAAMQRELERIAASPKLSKDVFEIVTRALGRS
ncbi:MAG: aminopeptidase N [Myxococcota bacterium]|nr:aminopeptidase N [Myxococcota bacterium]